MDPAAHVLGGLEDVAVGARVSGVAVVRWVGAPREVVTWTGAVVAKVDVELVDAALAPTTLAVWGRRGARAAASLSVPSVVAYSRARVSAYGGRSLNADAAPAPAAHAGLARLYGSPRVAAAASRASAAARAARARPGGAREPRAVTTRSLRRSPAFAASRRAALPRAHALSRLGGRGPSTRSARRLSAEIFAGAGKRRSRARLGRAAVPLLRSLLANYDAAALQGVYDRACGADPPRARTAASRRPGLKRATSYVTFGLECV